MKIETIKNICQKNYKFKIKFIATKKLDNN